MSPWNIILAIIIVGVLCAGSAYEGHKVGVNSQKVADQAQFDKYNSDIAAQKAQASAELASANTEVIAQKTKSDKLTHDLEVAHETDTQNTNRIHNLSMAYSLRFASAENSGRGDGSADAKAGTGDAAGDTGAAVCQLSDEASKSLDSIAYDADTLRDDYALLYKWAHGVTCY